MRTVSTSTASEKKTFKMFRHLRSPRWFSGAGARGAGAGAAFVLVCGSAGPTHLAHTAIHASTSLDCAARSLNVLCCMLPSDV